MYNNLLRLAHCITRRMHSINRNHSQRHKRQREQTTTTVFYTLWCPLVTRRDFSALIFALGYAISFDFCTRKTEKRFSIFPLRWIVIMYDSPIAEWFIENAHRTKLFRVYEFSLLNWLVRNVNAIGMQWKHLISSLLTHSIKKSKSPRITGQKKCEMRNASFIWNAYTGEAYGLWIRWLIHMHAMHAFLLLSQNHKLHCKTFIYLHQKLVYMLIAHTEDAAS